MPRLPKNKPGVTTPREDVINLGGGRFKLLAGQHQAAEPGWEPSPAEVKAAELRGTVPKAPTRTYNVGEIVESDDDLVAKFGHQKFIRVGGRKPFGATPGDAPSAQPASFPGGQVSSGRQEATGPTTSGPMDPEKSAALDRESEGKAADLRVKAEASSAEFGTELEGGEDLDDDGDEDKADAGEDAGERPDFDSMTVAELREYATDNEIDLKGATHKADIVKAVKRRK